MPKNCECGCPTGIFWDYLCPECREEFDAEMDEFARSDLFGAPPEVIYDELPEIDHQSETPPW